jgi:hypothetical protein
MFYRTVEQSGLTRKLKLTWPSLRSGPRSLTPVVGQTKARSPAET